MSKEIELTQGMTAIVDDSDYAHVMSLTWNLKRDHRNGDRYASHGCGKSFIPMQNFILGVPRGIEVDHRDGDQLNNRRNNLRVATRSQNCCNRKGWSKYGYKGVCRVNNWHKFSARIQINGKMQWLGSYSTPEEAARAYDVAAVTYHGEFAKLNFPP